MDKQKSGCGCTSKPQDTPNAEPVNLSQRELLIYQAGLSFGAAQALRQAAEQVAKLSQTIAAQANAQAAHGQEQLDKALALEQNPGKISPLANRAAKVFNALLGVDD